MNQNEGFVSLVLFTYLDPFRALHLQSFTSRKLVASSYNDLHHESKSESLSSTTIFPNLRHRLLSPGVSWKIA